ncbi:ABC transporter ATP-binding protein YtrB [Corynebacterium occultum]|uniref:ABC transporter ATP-binding protein YtrB n=1 Tax=Corynebacterium occultum TaxID=2675219 RepID=A0A6B8W035_9CORY|nr:ABC transporter ATP-binding protein [Corynebacterium occultum]QGU08599.1 ABC transporter ATP-binding protein YtrB [Corynebacterium occultum]
MSRVMVDARGLAAGYGKKEKVIRGLNFTLASGLIHGLIGENGAGKTTLLRVLAGQLHYEGELRVFGVDPFDNPTVLDRTILAGIDAPLPGSWSPRKLMAVAAARYNSWNEGRALELSKRFELPFGKAYSSLSRGQKSATSLVLAIASGCELLLLDEPYLGLDLRKREEFYRILREEMDRGGRTILLSTHHLHESEKLLDTVLYLKAGEVRINGPAHELSEQILEVFGAAEEVERLLRQLGSVPELRREEISIGRRSIIDLREQPALADAAYDLAHQIGGRLRVSGITLEQAVLAMSGEKR